MQGVYGGLVVIIAYSTYDPVVNNDKALLTESGIDIFTESLQEILVEP